MTQRNPQSVILKLPGARWSVRFDWNADRFAHTVLVDDVPVAESVEGDARDAWPPSPPIQQLSLEQVDGAPVLLGVGAAGRAHWSISVEVESHGDADALKFDLACRCDQEPRFLGSTYRHSRDVSLTPLEAADVAARDSESEPWPVTSSVVCAPSGSTTAQWSYRIAFPAVW